ncbi:DUF4924 family protein [Puteibacter caeruleilacunae]|nr:DUF4924 family protein [Puteibacter caeruleilacunae]
MLIAQKKRKENIAEYILYMWQIEDLIRANELDLDKIRRVLVDRYDQPAEVKEEIFTWYKNLVVMMEKERKQKVGHLQVIENLLNDVYEFHLRLMKSNTQPAYNTMYQSATGMIEEFKAKSGDKSLNDVAVCMNALYGVLMLKLQGREVSAATMNAITTFSKFLSGLSKLYLDFENGKFEM